MANRPRRAAKPQLSATDPPQEVELKLALPEDGAARLAERPLLRAAPGRLIRLDAIYYDTADRRLQQHGLALRLRREGRRWVQTLKSEGSARGGFSQRAEWESPARTLRGKPAFDLKAFVGSPLPALLSDGAARLRPLFRVRVLRTQWQCDTRGSRIAVMQDIGTIVALNRPRSRPQFVRELELELLAGSAGDLPAAALKLIGSGPDALALVPMVDSKAARGYRLAAAQPLAPAKASARGFVASLDAAMSTGAALRSIVSHGLDLVLANAAALRESQDPECVHQARVALRRVRSAIRLLDCGGEDFPPRLSEGLRWLGRALGAARDSDVLHEQTLPAVFAEAPPELRGEVQALLQAVGERRVAARAAALAAIATPRLARLALEVHGWTLTPAPPGRTLARRAPRVLDRAHARLFTAAQFFAALTPPRRHQVRILAKRLRYALDVLSVALPAAATERYIAALAELQDVLGELNDAAVASESLAALRVAPPLLEHLQRWSGQRELELVLQAERKLLALLETERPWSA